MRENRLQLSNPMRWPFWLQNIMLAAVGFPAAVMAAPYAVRHPELMLQVAVAVLVLLPAFMMASVSSGLLIPYALFIWVTGPEIRRLADWMMGSYETVSLLSLTPVLTTSLIAVALIKRPFTLEPASAATVKAFMIPYLYASAVGLVLNKLAGIYSLLHYFAPVLILIYLTVRPPTERQKDVWIRFYVTLAVILSIYGWFQYVTLPPWDRLWMESARMVSMGQPEPLMFRPFSTLNSNGTLAVFLMTALVPAIVHKRWRGPFGLIGVLLMISALAITLVRACWVTLVIGIIAYFLFASNAGRLRILVTIALIGAAGWFLLPLLPGGQAMTDRMATLGSLQQDQSASSRWTLVLYALPEIIKHPVGGGFGSIGRSAALNGDTVLAGLGSVDNGYLGVFATFGLFGGVLFFRALRVHWKFVAANDKTSLYRALGLATIVQLLVGFFFGGEMVGLGAVNFWFFTGLALIGGNPSYFNKSGGRPFGKQPDGDRQSRRPAWRGGTRAHEYAAASGPTEVQG